MSRVKYIFLDIKSLPIRVIYLLNKKDKYLKPIVRLCYFHPKGGNIYMTDEFQQDPPTSTSPSSLEITTIDYAKGQDGGTYHGTSQLHESGFNYSEHVSATVNKEGVVQQVSVDRK